jgi:hypothetical protein
MAALTPPNIEAKVRLWVAGETNCRAKGARIVLVKLREAIVKIAFEGMEL